MHPTRRLEEPLQLSVLPAKRLLRSPTRQFTLHPSPHQPNEREILLGEIVRTRATTREAQGPVYPILQPYADSQVRLHPEGLVGRMSLPFRIQNMVESDGPGRGKSLLAVSVSKVERLSRLQQIRRGAHVPYRILVVLDLGEDAYLEVEPLAPQAEEILHLVLKRGIGIGSDLEEVEGERSDIRGVVFQFVPHWTLPLLFGPMRRVTSAPSLQRKPQASSTTPVS